MQNGTTWAGVWPGGRGQHPSSCAKRHGRFKNLSQASHPLTPTSAGGNNRLFHLGSRLLAALYWWLLCSGKLPAAGGPGSLSWWPCQAGSWGRLAKGVCLLGVQGGGRFPLAPPGRWESLFPECTSLQAGQGQEVATAERWSQTRRKITMGLNQDLVPGKPKLGVSPGTGRF